MRGVVFLKACLMTVVGAFVTWLVFQVPTLVINSMLGAVARDPWFFGAPLLAGALLGIVFPFWHRLIAKIVGRAPLFAVSVAFWVPCLVVLVIWASLLQGGIGGNLPVFLIKKAIRIAVASFMGGFIMFLLGRILHYRLEDPTDVW
ncbi:MAG: hypothetical protein JXR37_19705 [Kiritimatiellae bacterium]|nr:hypothetical protein [Kiritimatiellia bacterium]